MARNNLFEGESYYAMFASLCYKWALSRKWFTYADIMAEHLMLDSTKDLPCNVSNCDNYGELKKAFRDIRKEIVNKEGFCCFEEDGNNRNKKFRYIGKSNAPLADIINAKVVNDLKQYWQFCQDSAGFFPNSWIEYFFKDCRDLLEIKYKKKNGEQVLTSSMDRILKNIDMLPFLYEAIIHKQVLAIEYKPFGGTPKEMIFHPHILREYNGRWFLFGHVNDREPEYGICIALDRIEKKPREVYNVEYKNAPQNFYEDFFKNIVGVTHKQDTEAINIHVRVHSLYMFNLIDTKPIHESHHVTVPFKEHENGTYGEFTIHTEINNELIGRFLQYGSDIEVVAPKEAREEVAKRIKKMYEHYNG